MNEKCTTHHLYFKSHKVKMRERLETYDVDRIFDTDHDPFILFFRSFLFFLSLHRNKMYNISMATLEENVLEVNEEFHFY